MSTRILKSFAAIAVLAAAGAAANTAEEKTKSKSPADGEIVVHLKGALMLGTKVKKGADPDARPHDDKAWEIASAVILSGGTHVQLDWRQSDAVRDELLWWRLPRHGDARQIQAEVTGIMRFKPTREIEGCMTDPKGITADTPVPIVAVKTLQVRLVGPDGEPQGDQLGRQRVGDD